MPRITETFRTFAPQNTYKVMDTTTILTLTLAAIAISLLITVVAATLTLLPAFPHYRRTYEAIRTGTITPNPEMSTEDMVYLTPPGGFNQGQSAIYFRRTGDFRLLGGQHLHTTPVTLFSPYSLYWLVRTKALLESRCPKTPQTQHDSKNQANSR